MLDNGKRSVVMQVLCCCSVDHASGSCLQSWVLKMLSEFVLLYGSSVNVMLRRDADGRTPRGGDHDACGHLIRHLMHVHLPNPPPALWGMQGLNELAAFLLLSICIRYAALCWGLVLHIRAHRVVA